MIFCDKTILLPLFPLIATSPPCARSYPRHACPLYVAFFMHLHEWSRTAPRLACAGIIRVQEFMRFHAA
ncbi:hypothetical protein CTZ24_13605 [Pantoea phytobeneficialis]|uniref:Uncharacterized protein n=1 Tax=Pantoea phytobeneficialis TaxID=2052056 RepID=A0AAP9KQ00_9GAMM|nr:hypothetical protein CTZ24_13605 [Pantoea phytobeneficialis]